MPARSSITFHTDPADKVSADFRTRTGTTWLSIDVGGADVTFFVTKDQGIAIGKGVMDAAEGWVKEEA